jgi:hypothetical protein
VSEDLRSAIEARLLDRLAVDDARLLELAGPSTLTAREIASLRRSAALRRVLRRVPFLREAARATYRAVRGSAGDSR